MKLYARHFDTPYGTMLVAVDEEGYLTRLIFPNGHDYWAEEIIRHKYNVNDAADRCDTVLTQLDEYFEGKRKRFDLLLRPNGTDFQRRVWTALLNIPYGETTTYKALALSLGNLAAIRAVGRANGQNPIPIIIPCHRVIGTDGTLTGFGGGLPLKQALLELEGAQIAPSVVDKQQLMLF